MSSPPAEDFPELPATAPESRRRRRPVETWRKIALAGALVLLGGSILDAAVEDFNRFLLTLSLGIGWGLLAAGFGRYMLDRRRRAAQQDQDR
jgi:hypothetical protein